MTIKVTVCKKNKSLEEKLKPSMGAGAYIKDFQKSKAKQFKGKSKAKKRKMAIAAYLQDKKGKLEEKKKTRGRKRKPGRSKKYFGSYFYDFGLLHGDSSAGSGGVDGGGAAGGDGNRGQRASESYCKSTPCDKMGFSQKASCKSQGFKNCYPTKESKDPKKGTGKKPKNSGRRLYTDENPNDTVSVKFATVQDIKDTLSKSSFKSKSHKRQSQIINLIHQRARAAYKNAKDPKVKARLKKSFEYAEKRKEASKEKTKRMQKEKTK